MFGVKEVIVGEDAVEKVKLLLEVAVLPFTTIIAPGAPEPTIAVICVAELTVKLWAGVPPTATAVAPVKFVPVITTDVPVPPVAGVKEVIVGEDAVAKVKLLLDGKEPKKVIFVRGRLVNIVI